MERNGIKRCRTISTQWDNLPRDIFETIFKNLSLGDRIRICAVCKYWNHVLSKFKHDILQIPDAPWKILSDDSYDSSEHFITEVSFKSLSDEKIYRFKLPDNRDRGWLCGSSRGWLLMATGDILNPDLFLWNPLNGSTKSLPPLSSHPRYQELVRPIRKGHMDNVSCLFNRVQVFSHGSAECVVAAIINQNVHFGNQLSFCMPHDERWTTYSEEKGDKIRYIDFIYCEKIGSLWFLKTSNLEMDTMDSSRSGVCVSGCKVPIFFIQTRCSSSCTRRLVEDTNGGVLVVEPSYFGSTGIDGFKRVITNHLVTARLSFIRFVENRSEEVTSIGNQTIFLGSTGTNSIIISNPVRGIKTDCVYLAIDNFSGSYSDGRRYTVREQCVYSLKSKRMSVNYPEKVRTPAPSKIGWFEPKIL